jgi:hypothetical protein
MVGGAPAEAERSAVSPGQRSEIGIPEAESILQQPLEDLSTFTITRKGEGAWIEALYMIDPAEGRMIWKASGSGLQPHLLILKDPDTGSTLSPIAFVQNPASGFSFLQGVSSGVSVTTTPAGRMEMTPLSVVSGGKISASNAFIEIPVIVTVKANEQKGFMKSPKMVFSISPAPGGKVSVNTRVNEPPAFRRGV